MLPLTSRGRGRRLFELALESKPGETEDKEESKQKLGTTKETTPQHVEPQVLETKEPQPHDLGSVGAPLYDCEQEYGHLPHDSVYTNIPDTYSPKSQESSLDLPLCGGSLALSLNFDSSTDTTLSADISDKLTLSGYKSQLSDLMTPSELRSPSSDKGKSVSRPESPENPLTLFKSDLNEKPFIICSAEFLTNSETTEELVIDWIKYILRRSLTSNDFCITFTSYFQKLILHKVFGKLIKDVTLNYVQEYYDERAANINGKRTQFDSHVNLLGQLFLRYLIKERPLSVLAQPLLEYLIMMCNNPTLASMKIVAEQICLNGKAMQSIEPKTMTQLIICIQHHLLVGISDFIVRTWFLLALNLCFYGQSLPEEIYNYFSKTIGGDEVQKIALLSKVKIHGELLDEFLKEFNHVFPG